MYFHIFAETRTGNSIDVQIECIFLLNRDFPNIPVGIKMLLQQQIRKTYIIQYTDTYRRIQKKYRKKDKIKQNVYISMYLSINVPFT